MSKTAGTKHDGNSDLLAAQVKNFEASNKKTLKLSRKLRKESPEAAWLRGQSAGFNVCAIRLKKTLAANVGAEPPAN
jgi:hypothetical protein